MHILRTCCPLTLLQKSNHPNFCTPGPLVMILMQQHNVKEEGILYPMVDQHLASYREELIERMDAVAIPA